MEIHKKTFEKLLPKDYVYKCREGDIKYLPEIVYSAHNDTIKYGRYGNDRLPRINKTSYKDNYGKVWFSHEPDAIRYAKAQLMKQLHLKIKKAKESIQELKDFRNKHYDKLNLDWTDVEIIKLEKELRY